MFKLNTFMITVILTLTLIGGNIASADYFAYRENKWDHEPLICLLKPENYKDFKQYGITMGKMVQAINIWKQKLNQYTESSNWNYSIKVLPTYTSMLEYDCDVRIEISNFGGKSFGQIDCYVIDERQFCDIVIYDQPANYFLGTITHEVGHALGLGHRLPWTKCDFAAVILSNDIMMKDSIKHPVITDESLRALIQFYGDDGFKTPNPVVGDNKYWITEKPLICA